LCCCFYAAVRLPTLARPPRVNGAATGPPNRIWPTIGEPVHGRPHGRRPAASLRLHPQRPSPGVLSPAWKPKAGDERYMAVLGPRGARRWSPRYRGFSSAFRPSVLERPVTRWTRRPVVQRSAVSTGRLPPSHRCTRGPTSRPRYRARTPKRSSHWSPAGAGPKTSGRRTGSSRRSSRRHPERRLALESREPGLPAR